MSDLTAVNRTALGVAGIRARESTRDDRLFDDPYAGRLAADHEPLPVVDAAAVTQRRRLRAHVVLRTRHYDELLLGAGTAQVVIVAAGMDARSWRLPWPRGTTVYELDQPQVLAYKADRLDETPAAHRRAVGVDLRDDWPTALRAAGFDADRPTAWLVEGLLAYLSPDEARALLAAVTDLSASGSVLGCERTGPTRRLPGTVTALWRGGIPEGATEALTTLGWQATEVDTRDLAHRWARPDLADVEGQLVTARLD